MSLLIVTKKGQEHLLKWVTYQTTPGSSRKIMLFKNNATFAFNTLLSGLTASTFPGYSTITYGSAYGPAAWDGTWAKAQAPGALFVCTSTPGTAESAYGYGIVHASTDLLWGVKFPTARLFDAAGKALLVRDYFRIQGLATGGLGTDAVVSSLGLEHFAKIATNQSVSDSSYVVRLFTNTPPLSPIMVITDFSEPSYSGYASQACPTFQAPFDSTPGFNFGLVTIAPYLQFQPSPGWTGSETINGYMVCGASSNSVIWAQYTNPTTFTTDFDFLYLVPQLRIKSLYDV